MGPVAHASSNKNCKTWVSVHKSNIFDDEDCGLIYLDVFLMTGLHSNGPSKV